jgi:hypothetical protein
MGSAKVSVGRRSRRNFFINERMERREMGESVA